MKTALKMVGYIIGFLLMAAGLIAIVLYIMGLAGGEDSIITTMPPSQQATPTPEVTPFTPTPTPEITPFIEATPTPTAEPTPTPSPEPTPSPTPVPDPAGMPLGSGKCSSETGVWLDLDAVWEAETVDSSTAKVTVTANLRSFRLQTGGTRNGLEIMVGDQVTVMDVEALEIETEEETSTELGKYEFIVKAPKGQATILPLEVNWYFGGTYSGQQLDKVSAIGQITLNR